MKAGVTDLSIDKIRYCYFDKGNLLLVIDAKDLKITTGP